ncbi:MAG: CPBP family intramembrane metalloprotease [Candidatus Bathyarchaeota archaeon]|nr:MAG: CPBP family intramembrane metalloprotease [Candidatus Bathyarchaeota archaeon]
MRREDWSFILTLVFLASLIILDLDYFRIETEFLFGSTPFGPSIFGIWSSYSILICFMIWGAEKSKAQLIPMDQIRRIGVAIKKTIRFIGISKLTQKDVFFILFSLLAGISLNLLINYAMSVLIGGEIVLSEAPRFDTFMQNTVVAPILEEFVYRAIPLSVLMRILGKNYAAAIFGIVLSSAVFGWVHPVNPGLKALGGMVLGCIYLFQWRKNFIASVSAHLGVNLVGSLLMVQVLTYSSC